MQRLCERFVQDNCTVDEEALDRIVASGEGHPRSTMLIAQQAHHASVEEGARHIDGTLAERGYRGALAADTGRHSDLMGRIRAMGSPAVASIVIRPGGRGSWRLGHPLFSAYVRREIRAG